MPRQIPDFIHKNRFACGLVLIFLPFLLLRLTLYLYYPIPGFSDDSYGYFIPFDPSSGELYNFSFRTLGYPLFLKIVHTLFNSNLAVCYAQSLSTMIASLMLFLTLYRYFKQLWFYAAITISLCVNSAIHFNLEASLLSDILFVNFLMISFSLFISALYSDKTRKWFLFSVFLGLTILIRPNGLIWFGIIFFIILFLWINRKPAIHAVALFLPFFIICLSHCVYNDYHSRVFTLSTAGHLNLLATSSPLLEPSQRYNDTSNCIIRSVTTGITENEKEIIEKSCDPQQILKVSTRITSSTFARFGQSWIAHQDGQKYLLTHPVFYSKIKMLTRDAIHSNRKLYAKIFLSRLYDYFTKNGVLGRQYFSNFIECYARLYVTYDREIPYEPHFLKEYFNPSEKLKENFYIISPDTSVKRGPITEIFFPSRESITSDAVQIARENYFLANLSDVLLMPVFYISLIPWGIFSILLFIVSGIILFKDPESKLALLVFILSLSVILHGVLICLVLQPMNRLVYHFYFAQLFSALFGAALCNKKRFS